MKYLNVAINFVKKKKRIFVTMGIIAVFIDIFLFPSTQSLLLLIISLYWISLSVVYKLHEKFFFGIALVFLVLTVPPFVIEHFTLAERISVWMYLFLILGLIQWMILEIVLPKFKR